MISSKLHHLANILSGSLLHLDHWGKGAKPWDQPLPLCARPKCDHDRHQEPHALADYVSHMILFLIPDPTSQYMILSLIPSF